jgi:hypothetical protein
VRLSHAPGFSHRCAPEGDTARSKVRRRREHVSAPTLPPPVVEADAEAGTRITMACWHYQLHRCEHSENMLIELKSTRSPNLGAARGVGRGVENWCPRSQTARYFKNRGRSSSEHCKRKSRSRRTPNSGATPAARQKHDFLRVHSQTVPGFRIAGRAGRRFSTGP